MGSGNQKEKEINFSQLMSDVDSGNVKEVTIIGMEVRGKYRNDNSGFHTTVPANYPDMIKTLRDKGVNISIRDVGSGSWTWIVNLAPLALLAALWFFMIRQMQTGGNKALSFGKSRARLLSMQQKKVTFKDVAGVDEAKEELKEIIEFLREAQKFQKLGGRILRGCCWLGLRERVRLCWRELWLARPMCRSSPSPAQILWRCSWVLALAGYVTCLSKARRMRLALSLSMKSMPWDVTAVPAWAAVTTSASKP